MPLSLIAIPAETLPTDLMDHAQPMLREVCVASQAMYRNCGFQEPWICYLARHDDHIVGTCAFKGPPSDGRVEIAYSTFAEFEGRGFGTAMARELVQIAEEFDREVVVTAKTSLVRNASRRILEKLSFVPCETSFADQAAAVQCWQRVQYRVNHPLSVDQFQDVLNRSTLGQRRPVDDRLILESMLKHADVIITAWIDGQTLIGISRALTDYAYCTYLSDLAVDVRFQRLGIGKQMIALTHLHAGLGTKLILLAAPKAVDYYPHVGFEKHESCWILREKT